MTLTNKDPTIPLVEGTLTIDGQLVISAIEDDTNWQDTTHRHISEDVQSINDPMGSSAFHANAQEPRDLDVTITSLLPLFPDDSKYVAMIRHSMDVAQSAVHVHLLNPGQVPVLILDQPLFVIANLIQWNWPDVYVEKFVNLLGGLHIEMDTHFHLSRCCYSRNS